MLDNTVNFDDFTADDFMNLMRAVRDTQPPGAPLYLPLVSIAAQSLPESQQTTDQIVRGQVLGKWKLTAPFSCGELVLVLRPFDQEQLQKSSPSVNTKNI